MTSLAFVFASALWQADPVTLTSPLAPAAVVLDQIAKAAGVKMRPSGSVKQDVFFVHFTATPLDVAMKRIAQTLDATWERSDDGTYVLTRTPAQERAPAEVGRRIQASIAKELATFNDHELTAADYTKAFEGTSNQQVSEWLQKNHPNSRLIWRLLRAIGPVGLAQLPAERASWFTASPTRRQYPLPVASQGALASFTREAAAIRQVVKSSPAGSPLRSLVSEPRDMDRATRLALKIERNGNGIGAELYGEFGDRTETDSAYLQEGMGEPLEPEANPLNSIGDEFATPPELLKLVRVARRSSLAPTPGDPVVDAAAWKDAVSDPGQHDFTTVFASEFLAQTARALGQDMVALLSDFGSLMPVFGVRDHDLKASIGHLWTTTPISTDSLVVRNDEGYISVKPADPARARERWPRQEIAKLAEAVVAGKSNVEVVADLVAKTNTNGAAIPSLLCAGFSVPDSRAALRSVLFSDFALWRVYGRLSPDQRASARKDGFAVPLDSPPPAMAPLIDDLVFGQNMKIDPPSGTRRELDSYASFCLGNVVPAGSRLVIRLKRSDVLYARSRQGDRVNTRPVTVEVAGAMAAYAASPNGLGGDDPYAVEGYAIGAEAELSLEFLYPGVGSARLSTKVPELPAGVRVVPAEELPAPWKEQLAAATALAKERMKTGGYRPPVPPP